MIIPKSISTASTIHEFTLNSIDGQPTPLEKANPSTGGAIGWNFTKFLADRSGKVVTRFASKVAPESSELINALEAALK